MNTEQWLYLYYAIKSFVKKYDGKTPDENAVSELHAFYWFVRRLIEKSDKKLPGTDKEIDAFFNCIMAIMQSLEMEDMPI